MTNEYDTGFVAGIEAAVTLGRAGVRPDDLATVLPSDPGRIDPREYSDLLGELRRAMGTDAIGAGDD